MKFNSLLFLITALFAFLVACSSEENIPPECYFIAPLRNSIFTVDDDLVIMINAVDKDGVIADIEILINEDVIATSNSSPLEYMYNLDGLNPGTYTLKARVTDDQGGETSVENQVTINPALEVFTDSRDGNIYRSVAIGDQTWMAENLAYLPSVSPSTRSSDVTPLYYVLGYDGDDVSTAKSEENYSIVGVHYNWVAANSCCPEGWHLPGTSDWEALEVYIISDQGSFDKEVYDWGYVWYGMGAHLMHTSGWGKQTYGMNTYSFSGLPSDGVPYIHFYDCDGCKTEEATVWWTSEPKVDFAITYGMNSAHPDFFAQAKLQKDFGACVRCIKNE
jgi:uncharacterized protein (TIGR02145 family)